MYSFTSSFRTEAKVIAVVLVFIASIEIGVRIFERRMAVGVHTPEASVTLQKGEGQKVLILGNSLVRDGVDVGLIESEIIAAGAGPVHVERAFLTSGTASDWYYLFKSSFVDSARLPDMLVLCFANDHLQDLRFQRPFVAHYYSHAHDISQIFAEEIDDFDGRSEFLLFAASLSLAERTSLHRRASDLLIPNYRESALRINEALRRDAATLTPLSGAGFRNIERMIRMAHENGVHLILTAMPTQKPYSIPSEVKELINTQNVTFFDTRNIEGLGGENFGDDAHLNNAGKAFFSRFLGGKLAEQLRQKEQSPTK